MRGAGKPPQGRGHALVLYSLKHEEVWLMPKKERDLRCCGGPLRTCLPVSTRCDVPSLSAHRTWGVTPRGQNALVVGRRTTSQIRSRSCL